MNLKTQMLNDFLITRTLIKNTKRAPNHRERVKLTIKTQPPKKTGLRLQNHRRAISAAPVSHVRCEAVIPEDHN